MKLLFLMLLSFNLFAGPKVGDYSEYELVLKANGQTYKGILTQEVTYISSDKIEVLTNSDILGNTSSDTVEYSVDDFIGAQEGSDIITYCQYLGVLEQMVIAGKSHQVCKMETEANGEPATTWIGSFPFAIAKYTGVEQGVNVTTTLTSFKFGY